ncbi:MAG: class I SAM-dependent methyltransferase [Bacteroidales bacterium]|nr:class I SAM-dependent methyltransferase [Bacteroidales bacterium]
MVLNSPQKEKYGKEQYSAIQAQRLAHEISFGPIVFQVSRLMVKFGIFRLLDDHKDGLTLDEIAQKSGISRYGVQVLVEASLTIGTVLLKDGKFHLAKAGWFLLNDTSIRINMDFNHDVNYRGMFYLEDAILKGKPEGLKTLGNWPTIYEGLSTLPEPAKTSWFAFDHFYSDNSFEQALEIVFAGHPAKILDVGGNTGRWAIQCVQHNPEVKVTIMDLPQQIELMRQQTKGLEGADRIDGYCGNLLDESTQLPQGYDIIWMSQFLDCFSETEVISILSRAAKAMSKDSHLFIMETFWDRQTFDAGSFCLAQISIYFTAMANGNSKMYYSGDMIRCIEKAGLRVNKIHDKLGLGHSIVECQL